VIALIVGYHGHYGGVEMYVRWKRSIVRRSADRRLSAVLVESRRIDGKPRQRVVRYLGSTWERQLGNPLERLGFWRGVDRHLAELALDDSTRERITDTLAMTVPPPSEEELHRDEAGRKQGLKRGTPVTARSERLSLSTALRRVLADGKWRSLRYVQNACGPVVRPEVAARRAIATIERNLRRPETGQRAREVEEYGTHELVAIGRRGIVLKVLNDLGAEYDRPQGAPDRLVRLPGMTRMDPP
jgi:hypothetical protein